MKPNEVVPSALRANRVCLASPVSRPSRNTTARSYSRRIRIEDAASVATTATSMERKTITAVMA